MIKAAIEQAPVDAPPSALASVTDAAPDDVVRKLKAHGIVATSAQSIRDLSVRSGEGENRLLGIVFLAE